ncbi:MAG: bifunctional ADP-heptose synthase [Flavobacteriales bacterium]|nr:bifunctional ADP-heptose synthase [Flavobacteriales bacterium]MDG1781331.1 bifunctional ADP-heptose synthase [Flavobacteriales bacterium]MDG2245928.1 bifunctional ADP-heptose synthase [Flavobacteriales bacterium]
MKGFTPDTSPTEFEALFERFNGKKVLVIGDVMIDAYYWGKVDRISPEAPVPVVQIDERENRLGGAANVALNVMTMGAIPIICAVVGQDEKGLLFDELLEKRGFTSEGIYKSTDRVTTVKTRIISGGHHLLRVDEETTKELNQLEEQGFIQSCLNTIATNDIDVIIFEDYNKGVLTQRVIEEITKVATEKGIPTTVDPKKEHYFDYKGVTLFKPNFKELVEGVKVEVEKSDDAGILHAVSTMETALNNEISLVTLSERGVLIKKGDDVTLIPAHAREILDVSGAGDTVISVASLALSENCSVQTIAALANLAGGLVCEKVGVVPIDKSLLLAEAKKLLTK